MKVCTELKLALTLLVGGICGLPTTLTIEYLVAKYGTVSQLEYWFGLPNIDTEAWVVQAADSNPQHLLLDASKSYMLLNFHLMWPTVVGILMILVSISIVFHVMRRLKGT